MMLVKMLVNPLLANIISVIEQVIAKVAELVDAPDLGSGIFDVRVRVSPFAPFWPGYGSITQDPGNHPVKNPYIENHEISTCKYQ